MFSPCRRGSASLAKLARLPFASRSLDLPFLLRYRQAQLLKSCRYAPIRGISVSQCHGQTAATRASALEKAFDDEVNAQKPPSDEHNQETTKHGPVTRFQELLDRGLVCETVVNTIVKDMGLETMTQVQSMTINETLKGIDVWAKPPRVLYLNGN